MKLELTKPYDRFRQLASFLGGYLKLPKDQDLDDLARIIKRYANVKKEYKIVNCRKCNTDVELEFYKPDINDDECSLPHFYCIMKN